MLTLVDQQRPASRPERHPHLADRRQSRSRWHLGQGDPRRRGRGPLGHTTNPVTRRGVMSPAPNLPLAPPSVHRRALLTWLGVFPVITPVSYTHLTLPTKRI